ncbi:hypothetical protein ADIMK_2086 [Marinobacterium lacunae]|uniref:Uncharacterized protein n=1 Tax=Marinobacterium lacunae TaxID=1232683 RepID=A0A081FZ29_9GAMM|nr:hypothetical protein [Marinobacterium lacunae]KEA63784.1 hypothetical protein ADIMK_2086 [Marinobacterium lacunae]
MTDRSVRCQPFQSAIDAINELNKADQMLLNCFYAEPEFMGMIRRNVLGLEAD